MDFALDDDAEALRLRLRAFLKNSATGPEAATARRWLDGLAADGKIVREGNPTP